VSLPRSLRTGRPVAKLCGPGSRADREQHAVGSTALWQRQGRPILGCNGTPLGGRPGRSDPPTGEKTALGGVAEESVPRRRSPLPTVWRKSGGHFRDGDSPHAAASSPPPSLNPRSSRRSSFASGPRSARPLSPPHARRLSISKDSPRAFPRGTVVSLSRLRLPPRALLENFPTSLGLDRSLSAQIPAIPREVEPRPPKTAAIRLTRRTVSG
jgi:hypothetical protein